MEILDAHHHLWDTRRLRYTLFDELPALNRPYTIDEFEPVAARNGVIGSICVEAASAGADGFSEATWLLGQGSAELVQGIVVWAPLERPDLAAYLDRLREIDDGRIVGVRRSFEFEEPDFASHDEVVAGVQEVARRGLVCDVVVFHPALPAVVDLVRACPEAMFVLDHLGKPPIRDGLLGLWSEHIAELASFPNIVCKISGLMTEADHARWRTEDLVPWIEHAIRCFGWSRVLFGSDWPVCRLAGTYERWLEVATTASRSATAEQKQAFFVDNARRAYRLDRAPGLRRLHDLPGFD
jgi:predicted TIM-barrel fold metal-dependent hydrolase